MALPLTLLGLMASLVAACDVRGDDRPDAGANAGQLELGAAAYERTCAVCHGAEGEGEPDWQVPRPDGSLPAPPHDSSGHTWHHPDSLLMEIIRDGGQVYMPNSGMPGFAGVLTEAEMEAVLAYIKTWWGPEELAYQAEQTRMHGR